MSKEFDTNKIADELGLSTGRDALKIVLVPGLAVPTMRKYLKYERKVLEELANQDRLNNSEQSICDKFSRRQSLTSKIFLYAGFGAADLIRTAGYAIFAYEIAKSLLEQ